jgi:hypothetical protein
LNDNAYVESLNRQEVDYGFYENQPQYYHSDNHQVNQNYPIAREESRQIELNQQDDMAVPSDNHLDSKSEDSYGDSLLPSAEPAVQNDISPLIQVEERHEDQIGEQVAGGAGDVSDSMHSFVFADPTTTSSAELVGATSGGSPQDDVDLECRQYCLDTETFTFEVNTEISADTHRYLAYVCREVNDSIAVQAALSALWNVSLAKSEDMTEIAMTAMAKWGKKGEEGVVSTALGLLRLGRSKIDLSVLAESLGDEGGDAILQVALVQRTLWGKSEADEPFVKRFTQQTSQWSSRANNIILG